MGKESDTIAYPGTGKIVGGEIHFSPGEIFGRRYQIIEEIGRGGMGRIYKAQDLELGVTVAIKMIHPYHSSKPQFIEQFKQETLLGRSISNENVIRIFDIGEADQIKFISMEYVKGQSLDELTMVSGALNVETAVHMALQICQALNAAHKKKVLHCDLKPSNIMVDSKGSVHITDFGLATLMGADQKISGKRIVGTPPYLSPEQALGKPLDRRSDIYSLGCVL